MTIISLFITFSLLMLSHIYWSMHISATLIFLEYHTFPNKYLFPIWTKIKRDYKKKILWYLHVWVGVVISYYHVLMLLRSLSHTHTHTLTHKHHESECERRGQKFPLMCGHHKSYPSNFFLSFSFFFRFFGAESPSFCLELGLTTQQQQQQQLSEWILAPQLLLWLHFWMHAGDCWAQPF